MSLFNEILAEQRMSYASDLCTVAKIRSLLEDPADQKDLDLAIESKEGETYRIEGTVIARRLNKVLGDKAFSIKGATVQRHRRGECCCR